MLRRPEERNEMVFYFTATGNSLYVAKQMDDNRISIAQAIHDREKIYTADRIGIVCPVFGHEMPELVKDFLKASRFKTDYFYILLTYGNRHGGAAEPAKEYAESLGIHPAYINVILMADNFLPGFDMEEQKALDKNEADVGRAVKDSGIPREEIYVTSKLWLQDYGYEAAKEGLSVSLEKLGMDYVDLYLLHQPYGDVAGAWKALEEAKEDGRIRSIGVSNMTPKIWNQWVSQFRTIPAVNQVECHPFFQQRALRELLAKDDVKIEAYQPLGHGDNMLLNHPVITELAKKYGKNAGQIILRFEIQDGLIVLPKSTHSDRIAGNLNLFDFKLTDDEMETLRALDTGKGHHDPETPGVAEMLLKNYKIHD